jgi:hypothetical protein
MKRACGMSELVSVKICGTWQLWQQKDMLAATCKVLYLNSYNNSDS